MLDKLLDMKTATVREVQHQLSRVLARVKRGEEITITSAAKQSPDWSHWRLWRNKAQANGRVLPAG
jgi:hypothetical protein